MKRLLLFLGLVACASDACALELLCKGTAYFEPNNADHSFVFEMDDKTRAGSAWTPDGPASGILKATAQNYSGIITARTGAKYFLVVDRYSGEVTIAPHPFPPGGGKITFSGFCQKAVRQF